MNTFSLPGGAAELIGKSGARATAIRTKVLSCLLAQPCAVTHHQVDFELSKTDPVDRVTLYRTLDWLIEHGLAHKVLGEDRVWYFSANAQEVVHHQHAHFKCTRCAKMICLDALPTPAKLPALPEGYRGVEVEITVKGLCDRCN